MVKRNPEPDSDVWSEWLLHRRHADNPDFARYVRGAVQSYADRVLDGAQLSAGMTMVDLGAGEGLVPFRAIERTRFAGARCARSGASGTDGVTR